MRDSRIELLRIVAAIMILSHHIVQHSGNEMGQLIASPLSVNQFISAAFGSWGQLGVTIFIIISSWFLAESGGGAIQEHFTHITTNMDCLFYVDFDRCYFK